MSSRRIGGALMAALLCASMAVPCGAAAQPAAPAEEASEAAQPVGQAQGAGTGEQAPGTPAPQADAGAQGAGEQAQGTQASGSPAAAGKASATAEPASEDAAQDAAEASGPDGKAGAEDMVEAAAVSAEASGPAAEESAPALSGRAHVQRDGWGAVRRGASGTYTFGTTGQSKRLEAIELRVAGGSVRYKAHVQREGWQPWRADGAQAGSTGLARRTEAVRLSLQGDLASRWELQYRVHVQTFGWTRWVRDGEVAGTTGLAKRLECVEVRVVPKGSALPSDSGAAPYTDAGMSVSAHVQREGWQPAKRGYNVTVGTTGRALRVEALTVSRPALDMSGDLQCNAHVQSIGWQGWRSSGSVAGTSGQAKRLEAVQMRLTGELGDRYDLWYRVHAQGAGWMAWAPEGERAGTEGLATRLEAVQIALVPQGGAAPSASGQTFSKAFVSGAGTVRYAAGSGGWVSGGAQLSAGGAGLADLRVSASGQAPGAAQLSVHVAKKGWLGWVADGEPAGGGAQVQAVRIRLTGEYSRLSSVWYRGYVQGVGWMGWARDGADAGSVGVGRPLTALQVVVQSRTAGAPGSTAMPLFRGTGDSELDSILQHIVSNVTGRGSDALRKGYEYVSGFEYANMNVYPAGNWEGWSKQYAKEMYRRGSGNCYRYASLMCWIARELGYEARVVSGEVMASSMGYQAHGWCEINQGGRWYIVDSDLHKFIPSRNFFMVTMEDAPVYYRYI